MGRLCEFIVKSCFQSCPGVRKLYLNDKRKLFAKRKQKKEKNERKRNRKI